MATNISVPPQKSAVGCLLTLLAKWLSYFLLVYWKQYLACGSLISSSLRSCSYLLLSQIWYLEIGRSTSANLPLNSLAKLGLYHREVRVHCTLNPCMPLSSLCSSHLTRNHITSFIFVSISVTLALIPSLIYTTNPPGFLPNLATFPFK
jgi:hypothetical protein